MGTAKSGNNEPAPGGSKSIPASPAGAAAIKGGVTPKGGPMKPGSKSGK